MDTKKPISKRIYSQKTIEYMLYGCILLGIIISIIANHYQSKDRDETSNRALIQTSASGYILSSLALALLIPFFIKLNTNPIKTNSVFESINRIFIYPMPIFITIVVFILATIQLLFFQDRLVKHHIANEYFTWNNSFSFLIIIQTIILLYYGFTNNNSKTPSNPSLRYIIYLFGLFNIIILGIIQVILQFFSTDG
jgi:hypothetical protein